MNRKNRDEPSDFENVLTGQTVRGFFFSFFGTYSSQVYSHCWSFKPSTSTTHDETIRLEIAPPSSSSSSSMSRSLSRSLSLCVLTDAVSAFLLLESFLLLLLLQFFVDDGLHGPLGYFTCFYFQPPRLAFTVNHSCLQSST